MQRNYCTSIPQAAGIRGIHSPSARHSHRHHVIPASHPTLRRHSHHHHVIPASHPTPPPSFPSPSRHSRLSSYPPTVIPITITSFPRRRESSGPHPTTHWWSHMSSHDSAPGLPFDLRAMAVIQLRYHGQVAASRSPRGIFQCSPHPIDVMTIYAIYQTTN